MIKSLKPGQEPVLEFSDLNPNVFEGVTSLSLPLREPLKRDVELGYEIFDENDQSIASGQYTLAKEAGSFILTGLPLPNDDALDGPTRPYRVVITEPSGRVNEILLSVLDNDDPPTLTVADASVAEGAPVSFVVSLSSVSGYDIVVSRKANSGGSATGSSDYTELAPLSFTIPAGQTSATIDVTTRGDALDDSDETFELILSAPQHVTIIDGTGVGTILDDDAEPSLEFVAATQSVGEASGSVTVSVQLSAVSGRVVSVPYTIAGTAAAAGVDHTLAAGTITIAAGAVMGQAIFSIVSDALSEASETVVLTLGAPSFASLGTQNSHTVTIIDDDGAPTLNVSDATVTEGGNLIFTVSLTGPVGVDVTFDWAASNGTALVADGDYAAGSGSGVTIASGQLSTTLTVSSTVDTRDEENETLSVTVSNVQNIAGGDLVATGTINDDDAAPTVSFALAAQSTGVETGTFTVQVNLSSVSGREVIVPLTVAAGSTATNVTDYTLSGATITITAGQTSGEVTLAVAVDALDEVTETVVLNLGTPTFATVSGITTHTLSIDDDDTAPSLSLASASAAEGTGLVFTISLSAVSGQAVSFSFSANSGGTATAGTDYVGLAATSLTIPAGGSSATVSVASTADSLDEADETFSASISSPVNASIATGAATGTITDDDAAPTLSIADLSVSEGTGAGSTNAVLTITSSASSGQAITIDYVTSDGTASQPGDYTSATGTATIAVGATATTLTVPISRDALDEADEAFTVTLSAGANYTSAGSDLSAMVTITDDDLAPSLSLADTSVTEGAGSVFTVSLSAASGKDVVFGYATATVTAVSPADYTAISGTATIAAGATEATFMVTTSDDALDEVDETYQMNIVNPVNATVADGTGVGTIQDNDTAPTISVADVSVTEGSGAGTSEAILTITASVASGLGITVDYATANGTASQPGDYTSTSGTATIAAGSTTTTLTVAIARDTADEQDEALTVALSNGANYTVAGSDLNAAVTITDDDTAPTLSIADVSVTEGSGAGTTEAVLTVTASAASGQEITVNYATADGTASQPGDYTLTSGTATIAEGSTTATLTVPISRDAVDESDETFTLTLSAGANYTVAGSDLSATATIQDDDGAGTLSIADVSLAEGTGAGTTQAVLTVTLAAASGLETTIDYATSNGTASQPGDYTLAAGTVTIAAGNTTGTLTVPISRDALDEVDESFTVTLSGGTNYVVGGSDLSAIVTITDDDAAPTLSIADLSLNEGSGAGTTDAVLTVTASAVSDQEITVNYATANGTATLADSDYSSAAGTATIAAGSTTATLTVSVQKDAKLEGDETFAVNLSAGANYTAAGSDLGATVTITNDDAAPTLSISDVTVTEGTGAVLTVSLSAASGLETTANYASTNGTAVQPGDYTSASGTATIAAGATSTTLTITTIDDSVDEGSESLTVTLTAPSNATLLDDVAA
ncbi:MAG: hypothetical protein NDI61_03670, partial [Bdellovibrionaceae bacterium]|nr:hypothetical protein [Pseudobdellovibrionaceae bacterium]